MRNSYPGPCYRCGLNVPARAGHFERIPRGGWRVQHADCAILWRVQHADCAILWRGKPAPTIAEARAALTARLQVIGPEGPPDRG